MHCSHKWRSPCNIQKKFWSHWLKFFIFPTNLRIFWEYFKLPCQQYQWYCDHYSVTKTHFSWEKILHCLKLQPYRINSIIDTFPSRSTKVALFPVLSKFLFSNSAFKSITRRSWSSRSTKITGVLIVLSKRTIKNFMMRKERMKSG